MVMQHDGGGSGFPPLPADAGPTERALYEIYDFQTGIVSYTASQWKTTADEITDLASSVRQVVRELRRAPDGGEAWSGSAAEAAYESLGKLATNLDRHAEDILNIEAGLTAASDAVSDARSAYVTRVRTVDTDIDQAGYMTGPPPPPVGPPVPKTLDTAAYDQAVSAARAQRESEAQSVMQAYDTRMETAAKKLPVEPAESPVSDGNYPSGPGTPGSYPGGSSGGGGGGYTPPKPTWDDVPTGDGGDDDENPTIWTPPTGNPDDEICSGVPIVSVDAPTETGGLTPGSGVPTPSTGTTTPGGVPSGGVGGAGAAMGMGGMVAGGGAAALFGRGGGAGLGLGSGRPGGVGASGRPGVVGVGSTGGAASRGNGGTAGRGGTGAGGTGRSTVVAGGGGQGAAGRGTGGRGGAGGRGAGRTGRYGVPQLGEKGGRGGAAGAAGTAGSRGGRRKDERDGQDVDHLTHEDEETWFEGSDDASPPVWE